MSLNKAIKSGKEHRKPYRGAKRFTCSCRNHGSCTYCLNNRMHSTKKRIPLVEPDETSISPA